MALFFCVVGLELKREALEGELSSRSQVVLPAVAALGGMAVPAAVYVLMNRGDPVALEGWAIPTATDIAFALGVLTLFGRRVPTGLKVFLLTLAVLDDLGAVVIIAAFYSGKIALGSLAFALVATVVLIVLNRSGVARLGPYAVIGILLWTSVLNSGVHATLAGVVIAFCIPLSAGKQLEASLHAPVSFFIMPLFAFANAGVPLLGISIAGLVEPVPLGIALGLLLGKASGVFTASFLCIRLGFARLPAGSTWSSLFGVCVLCGVGFTMSLFIGTLAFEEAGAEYIVSTRIGILAGSALSALLGYVILSRTLTR
jgi:Na+:H+ antiporter, NhaA family